MVLKVQDFFEYALHKFTLYSPAFTYKRKLIKFFKPIASHE